MKALLHSIYPYPPRTHHACSQAEEVTDWLTQVRYCASLRSKSPSLLQLHTDVWLMSAHRSRSQGLDDTHSHTDGVEFLCTDSKQSCRVKEPCSHSALGDCFCVPRRWSCLSSDLSGPQRRDSRDLWTQKVGSVSRRRIDVLWCGCIEVGRWPAERPVDVSQPMSHFRRGRWRKRQRDLLGAETESCAHVCYGSGLYTKSRHRCHIRHVWRKQMIFSVWMLLEAWRSAATNDLFVVVVVVVVDWCSAHYFFHSVSKVPITTSQRSPEIFFVLSDQQSEMQKKSFIYSFEMPEQGSVGQFFLRNHLNEYFLFFFKQRNTSFHLKCHKHINVSVFSVLNLHVHNCRLWAFVHIWPSTINDSMVD